MLALNYTFILYIMCLMYFYIQPQKLDEHNKNTTKQAKYQLKVIKQRNIVEELFVDVPCVSFVMDN